MFYSAPQLARHDVHLLGTRRQKRSRYVPRGPWQLGSIELSTFNGDLSMILGVDQRGPWKGHRKRRPISR